MAYYCSVNTSTFTSLGFLSHPSWTGAGNANWSIEWDFVFTALADNQFISGNTSGSTVRGIRLFLDGRISVNGVAAISVAPPGTVSAGVRYKAKLESVGTTKSLYLKLASDASYGSPVCTGTDNNSYLFNTVTRASTAYSRRFDVYGLATLGGTYSEAWDGTNAPSTGTTWTGASSNVITLTNTQGTADAWWVFYDAGDSLAFAGTLPKLTAAISATVSSGISASFSGTLPKLTAAISANVTYGISASFAGALPKLQASINAAVSTGTDSLSFSGTLPKLTASISATVSAAPNSLSFSGTLPKLRASISATVSLPPPLVAFSGTLPGLRMQAAMIVQVPEPAGDPLALKQALVNARRAEENRNNEYVPPVVIVPEWYIIQQRALGLKQGEVNRARDEE